MKIPLLKAAAGVLAITGASGQKIDVKEICKPEDKACHKNAQDNLKMLECTQMIITKSGGSFEMPTKDELKKTDPPKIDQRPLDRCDAITSELHKNPKLFENYPHPYFYGACLNQHLMEDGSGEKVSFDMSEPDAFKPNCDVHLKQLKTDYPNFFDTTCDQEL